MSARESKEPDVRRAEILDVAQRLFVEKGYEATSVSDIVKSLGIAQGTFYWHFKSKEEAFHEIAYRYAEERMVDIESIIRRSDISALEKIQGVLSSFSARNEVERQLVARVHSPAESALHDQIAREIGKRLMPLFAALIEQGVSEGILTTSYPEEAAAFMVAMGGAQSLIDTTDITREARKRWVKAYVEFLVHGLGYAGEQPIDLEELPGFGKPG